MSSIEQSYKTIMSNMTMSKDLRSRILESANDQYVHQKPLRKINANPKPKRLARRDFIKLGIAASCAAIGLGVAAPSIASTLASNQNRPNMATAPASSPMSFGLLAYASEPDAESNIVKDLKMDCFTTAHDQRGGWNAVESEDGSAARGWTFDFTCIGTGIASITCTFEGGPYDDDDHETNEYAFFYEETQTFDEDGNRTGAVGEWLGSITIPCKDNATLSSSEESDPSFHRAISVATHISDETIQYGKDYERLFSELYYSNHDKLDELLTQYTVRETYEVACRLAELPLVITATFEDDSEQTKKYRIAPKDDYIDKMVAQGIWFDDTGMYTITEIA